MQESPEVQPAKVQRAQKDIILAMCGLTETRLGPGNLGPGVNRRRNPKKGTVPETLFENGNNIVFCDVICTAYDRMGLGRTLMEFVEMLYGRVFNFSGAALRSTKSPYGFYLKMGFRPHDLKLGVTWLPSTKRNGGMNPMNVMTEDCPTKGYLLMRRFGQQVQ